MIRKRFFSRRGTVMVYVLTMAIIISMLIVAVLLFTINQYKVATHTERRNKAHYLALAGLRWGDWYEGQGSDLPDNKPGTRNMPFIDAETGDGEIYVYVWEDPSDVTIHSTAEFFMEPR